MSRDGADSRRWVTVMEQLKALLAEAQSRFQQLSPRDRRLLTLAGSAVGLFLFLILLFSFSNTAASYRRRTDQKLIKFREVQALAANYRDAEQARQRIEQQLTASNVSLVSYVEEKGTSAGLSIPTLTPKGDVPLAEGRIIESSVEIMMPDVRIDKLVGFLNDVERGPGVIKVKYLRMEPKPSAENLTAWATIATYRMKQ
jgi:general secretion pathway protein M